MRNCLLLFVFLFSFFSAYSQSGELAAYCNQQYDFCIHYPESVFTQEKKLNNSEGILLSSADGAIQMEIMGVSNINGWSTKDIYYLTFEDILTMHPSNRLLSAKIEPEFCIVESIIDDKKEYFEVRMVDEYYIVYKLTIPEYLSEMDYQHLLSQIGLANAPVEE